MYNVSWFLFQINVFFFLLSIQRILKHNTLKNGFPKNKQQTSKDADLGLDFIMKYINTENR